MNAITDYTVIVLSTDDKRQVDSITDTIEKRAVAAADRRYPDKTNYIFETMTCDKDNNFLTIYPTVFGV